ncbi:MAG: helix-turn-helix transcriptional regulator [Bacteroidales bacterium]|nr:helix-turn-helix transcriptional regulator [Bacteroidales bacterium]
MLRVKEIAKGKGLNIADVAKRMGIQAPALSRIINGSNTTTETLQKIASALEVEIVDLFESSRKNEFTCPNCGTRLTVTKL